MVAYNLRGIEKRLDLGKQAGFFHAKVGVKEMKEKEKMGAITIYLAYEFFVLCEYVKGMRRCRELLKKNDVEIDEIRELVEGTKKQPLEYARRFLDDLIENYSDEIKKGRIKKAISLCYMAKEGEK